MEKKWGSDQLKSLIQLCLDQLLHIIMKQHSIQFLLMQALQIEQLCDLRNIQLKINVFFTRKDYQKYLLHLLFQYLLKDMESYCHNYQPFHLSTNQGMKKLHDFSYIFLKTPTEAPLFWISSLKQVYYFGYYCDSELEHWSLNYQNQPLMDFQEALIN